MTASAALWAHDAASGPVTPVACPKPDSLACQKVGQLLARVGDRLSMLLVNALSERPHRFAELKRKVTGISQRMLTLTLRGLERDGLVSRTQFPTIPPRVDYALTPLGRSLVDPVQALGAWVLTHLAAIDVARARYDEHAAEPDPQRGAGQGQTHGSVPLG